MVILKLVFKGHPPWARHCARPLIRYCSLSVTWSGGVVGDSILISYMSTRGVPGRGASNGQITVTRCLLFLAVLRPLLLGKKETWH